MDRNIIDFKKKENNDEESLYCDECGKLLMKRKDGIACANFLCISTFPFYVGNSEPTIERTTTFRYCSKCTKLQFNIDLNIQVY